MAADRVSTTVTMCSPTCDAARRAASQVPESSEDRWMETTRSAPSSRARRYAATKSPGVGREVDTV
jgi:hypothetical protein